METCRFNNDQLPINLELQSLHYPANPRLVHICASRALPAGREQPEPVNEDNGVAPEAFARLTWAASCSVMVETFPSSPDKAFVSALGDVALAWCLILVLLLLTMPDVFQAIDLLCLV
jgi:hypothetical protein